jgi:hypothetical protein
LSLLIHILSDHYVTEIFCNNLIFYRNLCETTFLHDHYRTEVLLRLLHCLTTVANSTNSRQEENLMKNEMRIIGTALLLLVNSVSQAQDNAAMTNERTQQQIQMQSMSSDERALYQQLNGGGNEAGNGNMNHYGKGDGNGSGKKKQNRYGQTESSGYGTGYSSRQSNSSSGGKGRGRGH